MGADDGVRFWLDDKLVLDRWLEQSYTEFTINLDLRAGEHKLMVEFFESGGDAFVTLAWNQIPGAHNCVLPAEGLVAWWAGDGDFTNEVGGPEGKPVNGAGFASGADGDTGHRSAPGIVAQAFRFDIAGPQDDAGDYIDIPLAPAYADLQEFTIETWVFFNWEQQRWTELEDFFVTTSAILRKAGEGLLEFYLIADGQEYSLLSPVGLPVGEYVHVAATYDGRSMRLFWNGRQVAANTITGRPAPFEYLWLSHPQETLQGYLDEVSLYRRALSQEEIMMIYAAGKIGKCK